MPSTTALLTRPGYLLLLGALSVSSCVRLGPDFQAPGEAWSKQWNSAALEQASERAAQPDLRQWWQVFADPILDRLIAAADAHNSSLKIAGLRVLEARAQLGIAESGRYPQLQQVGVDSLYVDRHQSGGSNPQDLHFWQHNAAFDVGWELDFWGRFSRAIESSDASYFAAQANYEDALVLLRAQVADTYFSLRTTEARLRVARENAVQQKRNLKSPKNSSTAARRPNSTCNRRKPNTSARSAAFRPSRINCCARATLWRCWLASPPVAQHCWPSKPG
jgi:outer membrane protein TolC